MAPNQPRLRILSVGGNAVSAFLSWRLQATLACDVTLVWKAGFESVSQYGISFKSHKLGNERFKPHSVVRTPEDAAGSPEGFDYVLLCVKALPDVYDLATIIESVVSPHHTCIIINTTGSLGIEPYIESRFPTNVVLSLVSGVTVTQTGASEFEHTSSTDVWIGSANSNPNIPPSIQMDMAEALALTLASGNVECEVSVNIRQQQWEKMMGPIAFHPLSVLLETPNHPALMEKPGAKKLVSDLLDELISIAKAQSCSFLEDFKQKTIEAQLQQSSQHSMMYQDFLARRPMEIETYLGSPIKSAQMVGVKAPHTESLYAILHHVNQTNQTKALAQSSPQNPRSMQGPPRTQMNNMNNRRPPPPRGGPEMGMGPKRGPTSMPTSPNQNGLQPNGYPRRVNGRNSPLPPSAGVSRRNSFENDLEEFGHIALYGDLVDSDELPMQQDGSDYGRNRVPNANDIAMRERELALRQRELALREQEMNMRQNAKPGLLKMRRKSRSKSVYDDDDDDEVYFDPPSSNTPMPPIDADNFDMMSVTSRRTRKAPSAGNLKSPGAEIPLQPTRPRHSMNQGRPTVGRNRTSSRFGPPDGHGFHDPITENPLINYSSDRYGPADRKTLADTSRANSLTAQRLEDIRDNPVFTDMGRGGAYPPHPAQQSPTNRRTSTGGPDMRQNGYGPRPGYPPNRGPPNGQPIRQQGQRHPQDQGLPHQVEPQVSDGVSQANPMKGLSNNRERSTTGSASASASNDSGSGISAGEHSAYSSSSSLERRQGLAVR